MNPQHSNIQLTYARTNILLTINKLILRLKRDDLSDKQKQGVQTMINDCEQVLKTLKTISKENEELYSRIVKLHTENLELKQQILELTKTEDNATL